MSTLEGPPPLWVPENAREVLDRVAEIEAQLEKAEREGRVCPAATTGRYADTGAHYCKCGIAGDHFNMENNPMAALVWCLGDHADCPVWQAKDDDPKKVVRVHAAREKAKQDALTRQQIISGVRFDDRQVQLTDAKERIQALVQEAQAETNAAALETAAQIHHTQRRPRST